MSFEAIDCSDSRQNTVLIWFDCFTGWPCHFRKHYVCGVAADQWSVGGGVPFSTGELVGEGLGGTMPLPRPLPLQTTYYYQLQSRQARRPTAIDNSDSHPLVVLDSY